MAPTTLSAISVYRQRNAGTVSRLISQLPLDTHVHLHALDTVAGELAHLTRSSGPGGRIPLLQALYDYAQPPPQDAVLIFDDDVIFRSTGGRRFAGLAAAAGFDLAQPGHALGSRLSLPINRSRPLTVARRTGFVEVGPVVYVSPRSRCDVFPFPADARMGWGLDVQWTTLQRRGLRLGVVDATPMLHLGAVGVAYEGAYEYSALENALTDAGLTGTHDLTVNIGHAWRKGRRVPPWSIDGSGSETR